MIAAAAVTSIGLVFTGPAAGWSADRPPASWSATADGSGSWDLTVPEDGARLWIDVEAPSITDPAAASVSVTERGTTSRIPLKVTPFGLGAVVDVRPGDLDVAIIAPTSAMLSLTVENESGEAVWADTRRADDAATGEPGGGSGGGDNPGAPAGAAQGSGPGTAAGTSDDRLARSGAELFTPALAVGAVLAALGSILVIARRRKEKAL